VLAGAGIKVGLKKTGSFLRLALLFLLACDEPGRKRRHGQDILVLDKFLSF
jgi:hypothetical protein